MTALNERGRCWWVAPSYGQASGAWRELKDLARQLPGHLVREDERRITMPTGGTVEVKSAESGANLRGAGLDLVVVDEAAFIAEEVWSAVLRPALSDRQGKGLLISTPNGFNWFYDAWQRGQEGRSGWASWRFSTVDNPLIAVEEVDEARATLPAQVYAQEYEAAFTDAVGAVFRNVEALATAAHQDNAQQGHAYVIGADWARSGDYTVFAVFDVTINALVHLDRFTGVEFPQQRARLHGLCQSFKPSAIIAEANSIGQPQIEELRREGLPVQAFTTTNASKAALVDRAVLAFEQGTVSFIAHAVLLAELRAYVGERLPSGLMRYAARSGHDDTVMAFLLALEGAQRAAWRPRAQSYTETVWS